MKKLIFLTISLFLVIGTSFGQFISAKEFMDLYKTGNVIVVDADRPSNYAGTHVKNSVNIWTAEYFVKGQPDGLLLPKDELVAFFGSKGLSEDATIIMYDDGSNKYTSRLYFALKNVGAKDVRILHKDMNEWQKVRIPLNNTVPKIAPAVFNPTAESPIMIDIAYLKANANKDNLMVFDVRADKEYVGEDGKSLGHLPGAILMDYKDVLLANGDFKSKDQLQELADKYGITAEKEIIFYCNSGVKAAVNFIAFHDILGFPNVKVLDGGYNHWILDKENAIVK
ncbi:MAG: rhodanese-like domain-containing protein [Bacteroidales bacterium]|nr:rhodanese-like domain-containing protein [Bacteroidales bacterium]